jgi:hypothetical protein
MNKRKRVKIDYKLFDSLTSSSNPEEVVLQYSPTAFDFQQFQFQKRHENEKHHRHPSKTSLQKKPILQWRERVNDPKSWKVASEPLIEIIHSENLTLDRIIQTGFCKPILVLDGAAQLHCPKEQFTVDFIVEVVGMFLYNSESSRTEQKLSFLLKNMQTLHMTCFDYRGRRGSTRH